MCLPEVAKVTLKYSLPLYRGLGFFADDTGRTEQWGRINEPHPGLIFDKLIDTWEIKPDGACSIQEPNADADDDPGCKGSKRYWLERAKTHDVAYLGSRLKRARERHGKLIASLGGYYLIAETDWRFVSGLGNGHPFETGFTWHRTLGAPYLPGSSVKGLIRAWAEDWGAADPDEVKRLFGDTDTEGAGALIVFDAFPIEVPKLELDIMNPHYGPYYQDQSSSIPPADYHSPVPVFFLTVAAKTTFEFALAPRRPRDHKGKDAMEAGLKLLREALETLGSGGKTAVGYGRMVNARIENPNTTPEERIRAKVIQWSLDELAENIGKKWKKTLEDLGVALDVVKAAVESRPDIKTISEWQNSDKENQQKAYKRLFGGKTQ